jgi:hypothetical protein
MVGACCAVLAPLIARIEAHVFAAERLHGDDTTVPVLAKAKTALARCWVYVRDDRPFGGRAPPAAMFYYSRDRSGEHPAGHLANYDSPGRRLQRLHQAVQGRPPARGRSSRRGVGAVNGRRSFRRSGHLKFPSVTGPWSSIPLSCDPVAGVSLLSGVGA